MLPGPVCGAFSFRCISVCEQPALPRTAPTFSAQPSCSRAFPILAVGEETKRFRRIWLGMPSPTHRRSISEPIGANAESVTRRLGDALAYQAALFREKPLRVFEAARRYEPVDLAAANVGNDPRSAEPTLSRPWRHGGRCKPGWRAPKVKTPVFKVLPSESSGEDVKY